MKNFALVGAAGYVARRHMESIKNIHGNLAVAYDLSDSVGIIDSFFNKTQFYNTFEGFCDAICSMKEKKATQIDFCSICSPNYMHYLHAAAGLRMGCDVICEKPLVPKLAQLHKLMELERENGRKVFGILQLRYHPSVIALKNRVLNSRKDTKFDVTVTYVTARGNWYLKSWKSDPEKGFGLVANIGIHLFDLLHFIFGELKSNVVHFRERTRASGYLEFERARVRWFLSIQAEDVPIKDGVQSKVFREIDVSGDLLDLSGGFLDLHQKCYEEILVGRGLGLPELLNGISTVQKIQETSLSRPFSNEPHPFMALL